MTGPLTDQEAAVLRDAAWVMAAVTIGTVGRNHPRRSYRSTLAHSDALSVMMTFVEKRTEGKLTLRPLDCTRIPRDASEGSVFLVLCDESRPLTPVVALRSSDIVYELFADRGLLRLRHAPNMSQ